MSTPEDLDRTPPEPAQPGVPAQLSLPSERRGIRRRRRLAAIITVVAVVVAAGSFGVVHALSSAAASAPAAASNPVLHAVGPTPSPTMAAGTFAAAEPTMVLGDSLGLIVYPYFADLLPDRYVGYTGKVGSTTGWALEQLQNQQAAGTTIPNVVVISSGTNDEYLADFEQDAPKILALLGTERCVVWANIARPLASGDDPALINTYLQTITANSPNLHIVDWAAMAQSHPEWFGSDGIHPDADGANARAKAFAAAVEGCSPLNPNALPAPKQSLPQSIFYS